VSVREWSRRRAWLVFLTLIAALVALQWLLGWLIWPDLIDDPYVRYPVTFTVGALLGSGCALVGFRLFGPRTRRDR
jgi:hypothetical protein